MCVLCGVASLDVSIGLIAWREPIGRDVFTAAPRCKDKATCRTRVDAVGEEWDVIDRPLSATELLREDDR